MKNVFFGIVLALWMISCNDDDSSPVQDNVPDSGIDSVDGNFDSPFGALEYRLYYPTQKTDVGYIIHVSPGGNSFGDDRGKMRDFTAAYVEAGFLVLQIDHRFGGSDVPSIPRLRSQEVSFMISQLQAEMVNFGDYKGTVDISKQGIVGHWGGCVTGMMLAGAASVHGDYLLPEIKAVYGMSPPGSDPDQFGLQARPSGYAEVGDAAVFLVVGEAEKNTNRVGSFMAEDWRLQAYGALSEDAPRYQAYFRGLNTALEDIGGGNSMINQYNIQNSLALFQTFVGNTDRKSSIGTLAQPTDNVLVLDSKGL